MDETSTLQSELNLLDPERIRIRYDEFEDVMLVMDGAQQKVTAVRAFPLTAENEFIVLRDEDGDEVGSVRTLSALDAKSRAVLETELDKAYFRPQILEIYEIVESFHIPKFDVETDRGPRVFEIRSQRRDIRVLGNGRVIIRDADGNLYEIPDYRRLDTVSRALIEGYV